MINGLVSKRSVGHAISPLLLVLIVSFTSPLRPAWAGSIFDDDWSPPPAAPKTVEPPQQGETPGTGTPATLQPAPAPTEQPAPATAETPMPAAVAQRRSIPPKSDQSRSRKLFKDVYARELADQSAKGRVTLGKTLIREADKMASVPSDHFVLLLGAYEAGRDAANLGLCLSGHICGFDVIGGRNCDVNETHLEKPNSVRNGERCTCLVQVRRGSVAAYVNGQLFERCQVDYTQFSIDQVWDLGNDCLGIGGADNNVTFHAIELTEISGTGRRSPRLKE